MQPVLQVSQNNVANFEGVATDAFVPFEFKRYLLRMPTSIPSVLSSAGITGVTLANNHAFDYGLPGLLDSLYYLHAAGIQTAGAGLTQQAATAPMFVQTPHARICIIAISRTMPTSFWATPVRAGTAGLGIRDAAEEISQCAKAGYYTVGFFHWGIELSNHSKAAQQNYAHAMIDAGADLIIGHHPHVVQEMEVYKDRPIFYSLGNFAFGTLPHGRTQQGMAVRLRFGKKAEDPVTFSIIPLMVNNEVIAFKPRPIKAGEENPFASLMPRLKDCRWLPQQNEWQCAFLKTLHKIEADSAPTL